MLNLKTKEGYQNWHQNPKVTRQTPLKPKHNESFCLKKASESKGSVCIIKKIFYYEGTEHPVIKYKDEIWVKVKTVANVLMYKNTMKSIQDHVEPEDKTRLSELAPKSKGNETLPLEKNEKNTTYINESGLYSLILRSKLESARVFKRWVTKDVLPSIRNPGRYIYDDINHKYSDSLTFKIKNETDLHAKVVSFIKKRYPYSIFTATLGENQDTNKKRIESHKKVTLVALWI